MEGKWLNNKKLLSYFEGKTLSLKIDEEIVKMKLKNVDTMSDEEAEQVVQFLIASLQDNKILSFVATTYRLISQQVKSVAKKVKEKANESVLNFKNVLRNFIIKLKECGMIALHMFKKIHIKATFMKYYDKTIDSFYTLYKFLSESSRGFIKERILFTLDERSVYKKKKVKWRDKNKKTLMYQSSKILLSVSMGFSMCFMGIGNTYAATSKITELLSGKNASGDVFIGGNYIELGISKEGSFGSVGAAPANFHNNNRTLLNSTTSTIGMIANENGWFSNQKSSTVDFFMPGIIDEAWVVGINKNTSAIASAACNSSSYPKKQNLDNNFKTESLTNVAGKVIGARTTGTIMNGKIKVTQDILLGVDDKLYTTNVTLENISGNDINDVRYMRAFDPDQNSGMNDKNGYYVSGSMYTHNWVQNVAGKSAKVTAYGKSNQAPFIFYAADSRATAGYARTSSNGDVFYFTDVYNTKGNMRTSNTSDLSGTSNYIDGDIFIYFDLGKLAKGQSTDLTYYSSLNADIKVSTDKIDAKAVEDFIDEKVPDASSINKDTIATEKPKVDEANEKYEDLSDDAKKEISDESEKKLDAANDAVDKVIKDDYLKPLIDAIDKLPDSKDDLITIEDIKNLESVKDKKEEYDKLVQDGTKDTWLSSDKFDVDDDVTYSDVTDAFNKLENLSKDTPSSSTAKTYQVSFVLSGQRNITTKVNVLEGKTYTYTIDDLSSNERISVTSGNAETIGANQVVVKNVTSAQTIQVKVDNLTKDQLLSNLAKVLDQITVESGTEIGKLLSLLTNDLDSGIDFVLPSLTNELFSLEGVNVKVEKVLNAQNPLEQTITITLSKGGESVSKDIKVVFDGDKVAPVITKTTTQPELDQPEASKTLKFKLSDEGTGIDKDSIVVKCYLDPSKGFEVTKDTESNEFSFTVDQSDGYDITVKDHAGNKTTATYIVNSIDKEAPVIEGIENGKSYYLQHRIIIKDLNLKEVEINGVKYTSFKSEEGLMVYTVDLSEHKEHIITATDESGNKVTYKFTIQDLPTDSSARVEAIKTMRDELASQQTVLTEAEYDALDSQITSVEGNINSGVLAGYKNEFDNLDSTYPTLISYDQRTKFDELLKKVNDGLNYPGKITVEFSSARDQLIQKIEAKFTPLREEQVKVDTILKNVSAYNAATISSAEKGVLSAYQADLDKVKSVLLENGASNSSLISVKEKLKTLLEAIANLTKEIENLDSSLKNIKQENVNSGHKGTIDMVISDIKAYQVKKGDRLSDSDKVSLTEKLTNAEGLLTRINDVAKKLSVNTAIIEAITIEMVTKDSYNRALAALEAIEGVKGNLTSGENEKLTTLSTYVDKLKMQVDLDSIADIDASISGLTVENVTEDNRQTIKDVITAIEEIEKSATSEQKDVLTKKKNNANKLIERLDLIKSTVKETQDRLDGITDANVTSDKKEDLNQTIIEVENVLNTYQTNLVADQTTALNQVKETANALLTKIASVATEIQTIKEAAGLDVDTVTTESLTAVKDALGKIINLQGNLTVSEKATLDGYKISLEELDSQIEEVQTYLNELADLANKTIQDISSELIVRIDAVLLEDYNNHLTVDQKAIVSTQQTQLVELKEQLKNIDDAIAAIGNQISGMSVENVKISNKEKVLAAQKLIDEFVFNSDVLTSDQKTKFEEVKELTTDLIERIKLVEEALQSIDDKLENLTEDTINTGAKDNVLNAKQEIKDLMDAYSNNLLENQKTKLSGYNTLIPKLDAKIDEVQMYLDELNDLASKGIQDLSQDMIEKIERILLREYGTNLTAEQKTTVKTQQDQLTSLKEQFENIDKAIDAIGKLIIDMTVANVKTSDKENVDKAQKLVDELTFNLESLTAKQKEKLNDSKSLVKALLERITLVEETLQSIDNKLENLKENTVKTTDKVNVENGKQEIKNLLETYSSNLLEAQETKLNDYQTLIPTLEAKIKSAEDAWKELEDALAALGMTKARSVGLTLDTVTADNAEAIDNVIAAAQKVINEDAIPDDKKEVARALLEQYKAFKQRIADVKEKVDSANEGLEDVDLDKVTSDNKDQMKTVKDILDELETTYKDNTTNDQKSVVEEVKDKLIELETTLKEVTDAIVGVTGKLDDMSVTHIKDTQKDEMTSIKEAIDTIKKGMADHLSKGDLSQLEEYEEKITNLEKRIQDVEDSIQDVIDSNKDLTINGVDVSDKESIDEVNDKIQNIIKDYEDNLTDKNKEVLNKKEEQNQLLLDRIDLIVEVNKKLNDLNYSSSQIKEKAQAILDIYDQLSSEQKVSIDLDKIAYCQSVVKNGFVDTVDKDNVKVVGIGGTQFIKGTDIEMKDVLGQLDDDLDQKVKTNLNQFFDGYKFISLYDVKLVYMGHYVQPNGKIQIVFALPKDIELYEDIKAIYVDDEGHISEYPFEIKDGLIYIETNHLSYYGILAREKITNNDVTEIQPTDPSVKTSDTHMLELYSLMIMLSVAGFTVLRKKRQVQ